jgi:transcriptional regulator with XRE-family HTH domain
MEFGEVLRTERERCGYTQKELAEMIGVTDRTIQNYERGRANVARFEHLKALSEALGIELYEFGEKKTPSLSQTQKDEREITKLVNQMSALFAGGELSDDDKEAAVRAVTQAYWESKELNKKYGRKKARKNAKEN